ncbi:hypothetical protein F5146DRAFT_1144243 [Armillaria mellea]|nr:hypothetical protein F5146DRAFT_1144243 [Armillaria mellea]
MVFIADPSLFKEHPSVSDFNKASRFLRALRSSIKLEDVPSSFFSESCIQQLFRENPMYYINLARSHARRQIFEFEDTPLLCPYPLKLTWSGSRYLVAVQSYLKRLHHGSDALNDLAASSFWAPNNSNFQLGYNFKYADRVWKYLVLQTPPSLSFYFMTSVHSLETQDLTGVLHTFIKGTQACHFFDNGSASGKTLLLLEGLHQNWGLYFTATVDTSTLGSKDILDDTDRFRDGECFPQNTTTLKKILPLKPAWTSIPALFSEAASGEPDDPMRHRWVLAQLQPLFLQSAKGRDPQNFGALSSPFSPLGTPLFVVIDEGNVLADGGRYTFSNAFGDGRPILKELLTTWKHHLQVYNVAFIVAGTEIPREHFQGDEWCDFQWCSDTGDFGVPELQRQYIHEFLPPSILSSPSGEELQLRMWKWFRGRLVSLTLSSRTICDDMNLQA